MAVVIQKMVACDVAGVIFTCDPLSGNGSKMSIAANYGLGEVFSEVYQYLKKQLFCLICIFCVIMFRMFSTETLW